MASTIVVLCPHGRRQTVKVSPNTSILEILEEACRKQGIKPEDFDISHYNKRLDLSLSVRFANLPNNAMLELNPTKALRREGTVTVCLQLESGERLTENFPPSVSLWNIIEKCSITQLQSQNDDGQSEPVCVYMRQKIVGENLKTTTLRNLGLTNGKAIIRLMYRQPEEMTEQAHVSMPITKAIPFKEYPPLLPNHSSNKQIRLDSAYEESEQNQKISEKDNETIQHNQVEQNSSQQSNNPIAKSAPPIIDQNLEQGIKQKLEQEIKQKLEQEIKQNLEHEIKQSLKQKIKQSLEQEMDVNANGSTLQNEMSLAENTREIGEIIYLGPRNAVLFNLEDILEVKKADLSDEFFELTVEDVRYLMKELKSERLTLESKPLMLKSQREAKLLQQFRCYKQTVIRIYFPDKFVLQGTFIADETVQAVWDFVRNYLEDKNLDFYLYTTPPKTKLLPDTTLFQARLVPAAVIYFGCDARQTSILHPHIKSKISDPRAATLEAAQCRKQKEPVENIMMLDSNEESTEPEDNTICGNVEYQRYVPPSSHLDAKAPKWFKLGKK